jgi:hypothetical protein
MAIPCDFARKLSKLLLKCDGLAPWQCRNALGSSLRESKGKESITIPMTMANAMLEIFAEHAESCCDCLSEQHPSTCPAKKITDTQNELHKQLQRVQRRKARHEI